jgi:hypothetical protein
VKGSNSISIICSLCALVALMAAPEFSYAQTAPSARIEGLGPDYAGVVDDPVTDAALNPARVGAFDGAQVYAGRVGRRFEVFEFPEWQAYYAATLQPEAYGYLPRFLDADHPLTLVKPLAFTVFTPVGDGMEASFSVDAGVYGSERLDGSTRVNPTSSFSNGGYRSYADGGIDQTDFDEAVVDAALSTSRSPEARALGFRVTLKRKKYDSSYTNRHTTTDWPRDDVTEQIQRSRLDKSSEEYDEVRVGGAVGWYRPNGLFREASLTGGWLRVDRDFSLAYQDVYDEDLDNNGTRPDGGTPEYDFNLYESSSAREYTGGDISARIVFRYGSRFRSVHSASASRLVGDGDATTLADDLERDLGVDEQTRQDVAYSYDGTITSFEATTAVGYVEEVTERLTVAGVVHGRYTRGEFDENGKGDGVLMLRDQGVSSTYSSPYLQNVKLLDQVYAVRASAAAEWALPPYLTFRMGVVYEAQRVNVESNGRIDISGLEGVITDLVPVDNVDNALSYSTDTYFRAGLSAKVAQRLFVDMFTTTLSFSAFSYGTLRFVF